MKWINTSVISICVESGDVKADSYSVSKDSIVVLAVYGADVSSCDLSKENPISRRIKLNEALLSFGDKDRIYYTSRAAVKCVVEDDLKDSYLADIVLSTEKARAAELAVMRLAEVGNLRYVVKHPRMLNHVCRQWMRKLLLPLLSFWLVVLVFNFIASKQLDSKIGEARVQAHRNMQMSEKAQAVSALQERIVKEYQSLAIPACSREIDFVASVLPMNMVLNRIDVSRTALLLKGSAKDVQSIVVFGRVLNDESSIDAEIRSIDEKPEDGRIHFVIALNR